MNVHRGKETPALPRREDGLWFFVRKLSKAMQQRFSEHLSQHGVTLAQFEILTQLFRADGLTQAELAERCSKDAPTVTGVIDRLERESLVNRLQNPTDRRSYNIVLTDKGKKLRDTVPVIRKAMNDQAMQGMTSEEFEQLKTLLDKAERNFTARKEP